MIDWLNSWYIQNCDGDWEHGNGIKIYTIDNPGWTLEIDLWGLEFEDIPWNLIEVSDENWVGYTVNDGIFSASASPQHLNLLIKIFKHIDEDESNLLELITKTLKA